MTDRFQHHIDDEARLYSFSSAERQDKFAAAVLAISALTFFALRLVALSRVGPSDSSTWWRSRSSPTPCTVELAISIFIMPATWSVWFGDDAANGDLQKVDTLIIDKSGTMKECHRVFNRAVPNSGLEADEVVRWAASLNQGSAYPLPNAIVQAARERGLKLDKSENFDSASGIGVRTQVAGHYQLLLGNGAFMQQVNVFGSDDDFC